MTNKTERIKQIKLEIDFAEAGLEPERLYWDGERDRGQAMAEGAKLRAKLVKLRAELKNLGE